MNRLGLTLSYSTLLISIPFYPTLSYPLPVKICDGQIHGFAIRGDDKDEAVKKAKEEAEATTFKFISEVFEL